jgi:hypothetical protein
MRQDLKDANAFLTANASFSRKGVTGYEPSQNVTILERSLVMEKLDRVWALKQVVLFKGHVANYNDIFYPGNGKIVVKYAAREATTQHWKLCDQAAAVRSAKNLEIPVEVKLLVWNKLPPSITGVKHDNKPCKTGYFKAAIVDVRSTEFVLAILDHRQKRKQPTLMDCYKKHTKSQRLSQVSCAGPRP